MSKCLECLQARHTGMRSIATNHPLPVISHEIVQEQHCIAPQLQEYVMRAEIATLFRCNNAQYDDAYHHARKMLAREIYHEVLISLSRMRCMTDSGDEAAMHEELDRLEAWIND